MGDEIGLLVNRGFQMFWKSPSGRTAPALATHLKALHAFEEDLKEGLGLPSLYNESLGTTSDLHLYDRVQHRDQGDADKPWEHKPVTFVVPAYFEYSSWLFLASSRFPACSRTTPRRNRYRGKISEANSCSPDDSGRG